MLPLVYCDDKSIKLLKILDGSKTMIIRGATGRKIPYSRAFKDKILYFMKKEQKIIALDFDHQGNRNDWLIIEKIEDVVVGTSIPYNYEKSKF